MLSAIGLTVMRLTVCIQYPDKKSRPVLVDTNDNVRK